MRFPIRIFALFAGLLFVGMSYQARAQFTFATDSATNSVYSAGQGGWQSGDNGGSGFNAWSFNNANNTGVFIGDPANNGMGTTGIGTTAFGLFSTQNGNYYNATRYLSTGMGIGDTFSFYWAMNWDTGASGLNKGIEIRSGSTNIISINNAGTSSVITVNGVNSGSLYGTTPMLVTITRTSSSEYSFSMNDRDGSGTYSATISSSATIDGFNIYGSNNDNNGNRNVYYDDFANTNSGVFSQGGTVTNNNTFSGSGNLSIGNNTTLAMGGSATYTGTTTITNGSTLRFQSGNTFTFASAITGGTNSAIVMSNSSGQVNLSNNNTAFDGSITVAAGSLEVWTTNSLGSGTGTTTIQNGGTLRLWNTGGVTYAAEALSLNGTGVSSGGALRNITNNNTWQGAITLAGASRINSDAGTLTIDVASGNAISGSFDLTVGGAGNVTINDNANLGTGKLIKDGTGVLTLGAVMNYTNNTEINQGTLTIGSAGGLNSASTIFIGSGSGDFTSANAALSISNTGTIASPIRVNTSAGTGTRTLNALNTSGTATLTGGITLSRNLAIVANSGGNLLITNTALVMSNNTVNASITVSGSNNVTIGSTITAPSGVSDITMSGTGTLTVSGNNSSGNFVKYILNSGKLSFGSLNNIGQAGSFYNDKINFNGGTLLITDDVTIAVDTFGMTTSANGGTIEVASGKTFTQNAAFSSGNTGGVFNKTGAGTLVLGVTTNQMNPVFNIREGTVVVTATGALGSGNVINLGDTSTSGRLLWTGTNADTSRTITNNAGGGIINVSNAATALTLNTGMVYTGGFTKEGAGTLILGGTGSGSGKITISAGTLAIGSASALSASTAADAITLAGGTLRSSAGMTLGNRGITVTNSGGTIDVTTAGLTNTSGLNGSGALVKTGAGTLHLTNTSGNYAGAVTVTNGTLQFNTTNRGANITVGHASSQNGSVLMGAGQVGTVVINTNGRISPGNSVGTLSVSNTLTFNRGGSYLWEITNGASGAGAPGTNWDLITVDIAIAGAGGGTLQLDSAGTFTVNGLSTGITNFSPTNNYTNNYFQIVRATNTTGSLGTLSFIADTGLGTGAWTFATNTSGLFLNYVAPGVSLVFTNAVATNQGAANLVTNNPANSFAAITDSGGVTAVTISNTAPLIFTNANNSYSGVTTIEQGTLVATVNAPNDANGAFGKAATAVVMGSLVTSSNASLLIGNAGVDVGRAILVNSGGTGVRTIGATNSNGTATYSGSVTLNTNVTLSSSNSGATTLFSGAIGGAGVVAVAGPGQVVLSGANTYTNTTTVNNGATLVAANNTALGGGSGGTTVESGGTLAFSNNISEDEAISITGSGVGGGGAIRNVSGNNTNTGTITMTSSARINSDAGNLQLGSIAWGNSTNNLTLGGVGTTTITGGINGTATSSRILKDGTGNLVISNSGVTGNAQLQVANGKVTLAAGSFSTSTDTGIRALDLGLDAGDQSSTTDAAFYVNEGLTMSNSIYVAPAGTGGVGLRTLGTESTSGTVTFNNQAYLGDNATLRISSAGTANVIYSGNITNNLTNGTSATVLKVGSGTLTLSGANTWGGQFIAGAGTTVLSGGITDTNAVTVSNGATLRLGTGETIGSIAGGGNIELQTNSLIAGQNNANTEFSGVISSTTTNGILIKKGGGTLTLSGPNTMNGQLYLVAGNTLFAANQGVSFTNTINLGEDLGGTDNATLTLGGTGVTLFNLVNVRSGSSNNTMLIAASNTSGTSVLARGLTLNRAATLSAQGGGALVVSNAVTLGANQLRVTNAANSAVTIAGNISSTNRTSGELLVDGPGTTTITGNNSGDLKLTLSGGTLVVGNITNLGDPTETFFADKLNFNGGTLSVTNDITTGTNFGFTMSPNGGRVLVSSGKTFKMSDFINAPTNTSSYTFGIGGGGTLVLRDTGNNDFGNNATFAVTNNTTLQTANTLALGPLNSTALISLDAGTFAYTSNSATMSQRFTIGANGGTVSVSTTNQVLTLTNAVTLTGNLTKTGSGILVLSGAKTGTGSAAVNGGVLRIDNINSLGTGTGTVSVGSGATLELNNGISFNRNLNLSGNGTVSGALLSVGGANTSSGGITLGADARLGVSAGSLVVSGNITNAGHRLTLDTYGLANAPLTVSGAVSGEGGLTKIGGGRAVLSGSNSFAGGVNLEIGTLRLNSTNALGTGSLTQSSGTTLEINTTGTISNAMSLYNVAYLTNSKLSGNLTLNNATFDVTNNVVSTNSGILSGSGGVTKTGAGTLVLEGTNNSYTGDTDIQNGTLSVAYLANTNANSSIGKSNSLTIGSAGNAGTFLYTAAGTTNTTDRTIKVGSAGGTFNVESSNSRVTLTGVVTNLSGNATLTKSGAGTLALASAANSIRVSTIAVQQGTLLLGAANQINSTNTAISLANNTVLDTAGFADQAGRLSFSGASNSVSVTIKGLVANSESTFIFSDLDTSSAGNLKSGGLVFTGNYNFDTGFSIKLFSSTATADWLSSNSFSSKVSFGEGQLTGGISFGTGGGTGTYLNVAAIPDARVYSAAAFLLVLIGATELKRRRKRAQRAV